MHRAVVKSVRRVGGEERFAIFVIDSIPPTGHSVVVGGPDGGADHRGYTRGELRKQLRDVYGISDENVDALID